MKVIGVRKCSLLGGAAVLAALALAPVGPAADDPNGFVRNRVSLNQTVGQLVKNRYAVEIKCAEECLMKTRLLIAPADATRLGFKHVKRRVYYEIGRVERTLPAEEWTKVTMRLTPEARRRIAAAHTGVRVAGQVVAHSTESERSGWASWIRSCRLRAG